VRVTRLVCFVRSHHWETLTDTGGALTTCTRRGTIRHDPAPSARRGGEGMRTAAASGYLASGGETAAGEAGDADDR
jgi:hypothetical protein